MEFEYVHKEFLGTHRVATLLVAPAALVARFGPGWPANSGDGKVSTEWVFKGKRQTFMVYDYKMTCLYEDGLPTREQLLKSEKPRGFSITVERLAFPRRGGIPYFQRFKAWIEAEVPGAQVLSEREYAELLQKTWEERRENG